MHECPRCGYISGNKTDMERHFSRKKTCEYVLNDTKIEACFQMLKINKLKIINTGDHKCKCGKIFDRKIRLNNHMKKCKGEDKVDKLEKDIYQLKNYMKILQQPKIPQQKSDLQFVYILQEREFINSGEPVYKIGKTINPKNRMSSYPKASNVLGNYLCGDCHTTEKSLIELFDVKFIKRKDLGLEYYQGDINEMVNEIYFLILNKS
jgi:hypothetical protein